MLSCTAALAPLCAPACTLTFAGISSATAVYNPFDPVPARAPAELHIRNSGTAACDGSVSFSKEGEPAATGGGLPRLTYALQAPSGPVQIGRSFHEAVQPPAVATGLLRSGETRTIPIEFVVYPGQVVPPGMYKDSIRAAVYERQAAGSGAIHNFIAVPIVYRVDPVMSVNIAGGGDGATLDFGVLSAGGVRSVHLQARSNRPYRFEASSGNAGAMRLEPSSPDGMTWQVPYTVRAGNGPEVSLRAPRVLVMSSQPTPLQGTSIPIEVRIGDASAKRAGRYRDVIVITIDAAY